MQICTITLKLRGDLNHQLSEKRVTIPEIAVLKRLHGDDAVTDIKLIEFVKGFDHNEERIRLKKTYQKGGGFGGEGSRAINIDQIFGAFERLPATLGAIGINPKDEAQKLRDRAKQMLAEAEAILGKSQADIEVEEAEEAAAAEEFAEFNPSADEDDDGPDAVIVGRVAKPVRASEDASVFE